jgi:mono/diheme cytochrome c family protein
MKKISIILSLAAGAIMVSCGGVQREPNSIYMPDMAYSRAYETYADHSNLKEAGINYNNMPVEGTVARGQEMPFHIAKDAPGDSVNYVASKAVPNPIKSLTPLEMTEAERLYLVQCGICHGTKLDGNGPLYKDGNGPYPAAPRNLLDAYSKSMPDGQMFYSITYGKNLMGPYGAQVTRKQRWMIVHYIRAMQNGGTKAAAATDSTATAAK